MNQVELELFERLEHLVALAMARDIPIIDEVFLNVYGQSYQKWILHSWNVSDGTFAPESEQAQHFLGSIEKLIAAFKIRLHELIDSI